MLKRTLLLAAAVALVWVMPVAAAGSRHVFVDFYDIELCAVGHEVTWTPVAGQTTLRRTFTDLTTGLSEGFDQALAPTDSGGAASNLVGDHGSVGLGHAWRLSAQVLDASENVLAKGKKRAIIDCEISP